MNVALIGCGRISAKHIIAIESSGLHLYTSCDIDLDRALRCKPNAIYTDYEIMLGDRPNIDIVSICTPSNLHFEMAIEAAANGKHLIVEKPLSLSDTGAKVVKETCDEAGIKLCVVAQNRFNPPMQFLKEKIDEGSLGKILLANATVRWYRPPSYYDGTWQGTEDGGGVLLNQACHHLDALLWLVGDVASVTAYAETLDHDIPCPDATVAILKFWNGAIGSFEASVCAYPKNIESSVSIIGTKGTIKIGGDALNKLVYYQIDNEITFSEKPWLTDDIYGYGHIELYKDMVEAIKEDREPLSNGWWGVRSVVLANAMYRSAIEKREVHLE